MTGRLEAKFAPAFSRDLKKKADKRNWNLTELEAVIDRKSTRLNSSH